MIRRFMAIGILMLMLAAVAAAPAKAQDAAAIVDKAFNYLRGKASISTVDMTIHRPEWERNMTLKGWTKGQSESLIIITAPAKDEGNGTLKKGSEMWTFNPKVNRVIKLPPSMMSQSWLGSDFSNNDLAKTDSIINDYTHSLDGQETRDGHTVYRIKSMPKPEAPVIWGMQVLEIRDDGITLATEFYDEDLELVKSLKMLEIQELGGRLYPKVWKMQPADEPEKYTQLEYKELAFEDTLPDSVFTLANLKNPRR